MSKESRGLRYHPDFLKLWAGQAISMVGSRVGGFAYDLTAILTLHASPSQMAVLNGCMLFPAMIAGPCVGLWADRMRRRSLLIIADLGRAIALLTIPLTAIAHALTIVQLDVVAAVVSGLTVLFDVSYRAYLPALVGSEHLTEANSKLQGTAAVAEAGGWSIAGLLVQIFTAPLVVAVDAVSFLVSALFLAGLKNEVRPPARTRSDRAWADLRAGVAVIRHDPILRALAATAVTWDFVGSIIGVVILLFFVRDLRLTPVMLGPLTAIGGLSALAGAVIAGRVVRRFGLMRTLIGSLYLNNIGLLAVAVASGPLALVVLLVALDQSTDAGRAIYEIHSLSLLQRRVPEHLAERVNATFTTISSIAIALGLITGGILGQDLGVRPTIWLAFGGSMLVPVWLLRCDRSTMLGIKPRHRSRETEG